MSLRGHHLRVGAGEFVPWVLLDHPENQSLVRASGLFIDFMNIFAEKLKFTYSIIEATDGEWGRILPNGSSTGLIGLCHRKEADLAIGPFSITLSRSKIIDFSEPVYMDNSGIFLPRPKKEIDLASFSKPFDWQVWLILLLSLMVSEVVGCIINWTYRQSCEVTGLNQSLIIQPVGFIKLLINQSIDIPSNAFSAHALASTWVLIAVILSSAYQSILTSMLTVPKMEIPVDSLQDLVQYGRIPWAIEYGTELHEYFGEATSGVQKRVKDRAFLISTTYEVKDRMKEEKFAVLGDLFSMKQIMSEDYSYTGKCNYYIAKETILTVINAMAFPKGSPLTPHFNKWITRLKHAGLIDKNKEDSTSNATVCMMTPGKEGGSTSPVLSLADLLSIFLLYAIGITMSSIIFLSEILIIKVKRFR